MKGKVWKRTMQVVGALIIAVMALFSYKGNKSQKMPAVSTLKENTLAICGEKPNCVSSFQDEADDHYIIPIDIAQFDLTKADEFFKNCKLEQKTESYRYYTCSSNMFRFVDDIEILMTQEKVHIRSASRVGHSDLGANRKRMESFRSSLK